MTTPVKGNNLDDYPPLSVLTLNIDIDSLQDQYDYILNTIEYLIEMIKK